MTKEKRYRLLRDLPDCEAGRLIKYDNTAKEWFAITHGGSKIYFQERTVEDNNNWFEEIKEPERIQVERITEFGRGGSNEDVWNRSYYIRLSQSIPKEKLQLSKEAIEAILNNDEPKDGYNLSYVKGLNDKIEALEIIHEAYRHLSSQKLFTQQQMDEAIEKVFKAAREYNMYSPILPDPFRYLTLHDYIKSITT